MRRRQGGRLEALLMLVVVACGGESSPDSTNAQPSGVASSSSAPPAVVVPVEQPNGSSIVRLMNRESLVVADEDHSALRIISLLFGEPLHLEPTVTSFDLPGKPAQLVATPTGVLVTIRSLDNGGALIAYRATDDGFEETNRTALPYDAWGLAVDVAGTFALVSSPWSSSITRVDLRSFEAGEPIALPREPRGIAIHPDGKRAYVSHLVGTAITRIDLPGGGANAATEIALPAGPLRSYGHEPNRASLGYAALIDPKGQRGFFPRHALGAVGGDAWFGTASVDVLSLVDDRPVAPLQTGVKASTTAPPFEATRKQNIWNPARERHPEAGSQAFVQPRAAVYRSSEQSILVASEGTDAIVELDALMAAPTFGVMRTYELGHHHPTLGTATTGGAPSGIVLSKDESKAFVYCRSTDEVVRVSLVRGEEGVHPLPPFAVSLTAPNADESYAFGRKLFYNATDGVTSGGLACAGCHPEGRDDGHVWHEATFTSPEGPLFGRPITIFIGGVGNARELLARWQSMTVSEALGPDDRPTAVGFPRQTPMLAGRVNAKGPYGWHGESGTLHARITAGFGLHRWGESEGGEESATIRATHLVEFLRRGLVAPRPGQSESDATKRGEQVFMSEQTQCARCHVPATEYSDRASVALRDVPPLAGYADEKSREFKTPSLRFVGQTPPYFHDGRYLTLEDLLEKNADGMGKTSHLSPEQKRDLVAFLRSL